MGEFADEIIDNLLMDEEDDGPDNYVGPYNGRRPTPKTITCKFCGATDFVWGKVFDSHTKKTSWRLFKDGVGHVCKYKNK